MAFSGILFGLIVATQGTVDLVFRHDISPRYNRTDYEAPCGTNLFQVRFRNGPAEHGLVDYLMIDGRPVRGAAETLELRAARRLITSIEILDCAADPQRPVLRGKINFERMESQRLGMRRSLTFRITREGGDSWKISID